MYWKSKTNTGRVVYDRKKKLFTWGDVMRIMRKLKTEDLTDKQRSFLIFKAGVPAKVKPTRLGIQDVTALNLFLWIMARLNATLAREIIPFGDFLGILVDISGEMWKRAILFVRPDFIFPVEFGVTPYEEFSALFTDLADLIGLLTAGKSQGLLEEKIEEYIE